MKTIISALMLMGMFATTAFADFNTAAFPVISGYSSSIVTTSAFNVRNFLTKTLTVAGVSSDSSTAATMQGIIVADCGPTSSGPWATCVQMNVSALQPGVSLTQNGVISWQDAVAYIRLRWQAGTSAFPAYFKAWLNWSN